jgi:outer membrane murein-binding lipoprotein Lpp
MSSGIMRPILFGGAVALAVTAYYGFSQHQKVEDYRAAHAALKAERDTLLAKTDQLGADAAAAKRALQEAEAKMATLQAAVDTKKTATR